MSKRNSILAALLVVFLIGLFYHKPLTTHLKIILFITQQFPQIPIKPLGLVTSKPEHQKVEFETGHGKVVADLFVPQEGDKHGAVIMAMGVKTQPKDKPLVLSFANTMARLGYISFWPRLEVLDKGTSLPEEPATFVESFKYVEKLPSVDPERISYVGFSVGSSTALVASTHQQIKDQVYSLVFFGGYFDIFDYLLALDKQTPWQPHQDAINHAKTLLVAKEIATQPAQLIQGKDADNLKRYSPKEFIVDFKAKIFILHDKSDTYVPYTESIKLNQALSQKQDKEFLITDLFEHVQPNRPINFVELAKLYGFLYKVFTSL